MAVNEPLEWAMTKGVRLDTAETPAPPKTSEDKMTKAPTTREGSRGFVLVGQWSLGCSSHEPGSHLRCERYWSA
jgi:hypothetical protein